MRTIADRLRRRMVEDEWGCWLWTGSTGSNGYGRLNLNSGERFVPAHRLAFELRRGPIAPGLVIDHLCEKPTCLNPTHMEPVTQAVNAWRSRAATSVAHRAGTCTKGHPASEFNRRADGRVVYCRACRREARAA